MPSLYEVKKRLLALCWNLQVDLDGLASLLLPFAGWATANVLGIGTRETEQKLEIYLMAPAVFGFSGLIEANAFGYGFELVVTGRMRLAAGLQADINLHGGANGKIGLYLQSPDGAARYALTCSHVLDGTPGSTFAAPREVRTGGGTVGFLAHKIPLTTALPHFLPGGNVIAPNEVDCALARLTNGVVAVNSLPDGSAVGRHARAAAENQQVLLIGGTSTVRTTTADLKLSDDNNNDFYFESMTVVRGGPGSNVVRGQSGSLVTDAALNPVGLAIGFSDGTAVGATSFGPGGVVCDLGRILAKLAPETGPLQII